MRAYLVAILLLLALGAGAKSRFSIRLVIAAGMMVGTLFTLFVLPTFYVSLGGRKKPVDAERSQPALNAHV